MTPETEQAPTGHFRRPRLSPAGTTVSPAGMAPPRMSPQDLRSLVRDTDGRVRSEDPNRFAELAPQAAPAGQRAGQRRRPGNGPPPTRPEPAAATERARDGGSIVSVVPYLAVLIAAIAGVYVAWRQGSAGGGLGGVVGGVALLAAAVLRLMLPARLVGLLGTRKRVTDVLTLAVFGGGLLVAGLVLPH